MIARRIGIRAYRRGRWNLARRALGVAVGLDPGDTVARLNLARAERDSGRLEQSLDTVAAGLARSPGWALGIRHAADLQVRIGDLGAARRTLAELGPLERQDPDDLRGLERLADRIGEVELAQRIAAELLTREADSRGLLDGRQADPLALLPQLRAACLRAPDDRELGVAMYDAARASLDRPQGRGHTATDERIAEALGGPLTPPVGDGDRRSLVIVERGVDRRLLAGYLRACPDADCVSEASLPPSTDPSRLGGLRPATGLGAIGTSDDIGLCRTTDRIAERLWTALAEAIEPAARTGHGVDLLAQMSYWIDDQLFHLGRAVRPLRALIDSGEYGRVLFLVGDDRLNRCLRGSAEAAVGPDEVSLIRLSRGPQAARSPAPEPAPPPSAPAVPPPGARDRPLVTMLPGPNPRFTRNLEVIARELPDDHHVSFLIPGSGSRPATAPLEELAESDPARFSCLVCELDAEPAPIDVDAVIERVRADARVEGIELDGVPLWPLLEPIARRAALRLPGLRRFTRGFEEHLRSAGPRTVVVCPDRTPEARTACLFARAHGVPSIYPFDALVADSPRHKPVQADLATLLDQGQVELYERMHPSSTGRLLAAGLPRFDGVVKARARGVEEPSGPKTIALVLQPLSLEYNERLIRLVAEAAGALGVELEVRAHPNEPEADRRRYPEILDSVAPDGGLRMHEGDLVELLGRADLVVSGFSNVLVEAAILGRLALSANLTGSPFPLRFGEWGIAVEADGPAEVEAEIRALLTDETRIAAARRLQEGYFDRNPHVRDGPAARRIAGLVLAPPEGTGSQSPSGSGA